ncbi:hypothetical protein V499_09152 [Pseudogymnoascus sp. VKM F-103]|uniref:Bromodomain associated domain-containing protein n=1 Tax=Pseudogymnoascus verrucosus TaxID=342668 RepID=A0A1B8GGW9_9PEZI|nr:uncharacterized protein VE01_07333 [Pseudogymnoascus verrucosus]KFY70461.1 hypothetical protein V499_09152 [Pseudogymnoascus sp. VKM F-103]OBT95066.1 hypothetical protein VE01_07333 [Pseudogymnoascus verrucosus]
MSSHAIHHALLRPCVLHILRAAGYHSTKPSVLDALTDIAGRYMHLLATSTANHAAADPTELGISIADVRLAMQDCAAIVPEKVWEDQVFDGEEDVRGVEVFVEWARGEANREIRRVALEGGEEGGGDYLMALKKKHDKGDEESRYTGTIIGHEAEPRAIPVEGGDITSLKEWADILHRNAAKQTVSSEDTSRRQSSELSSVGDGDQDMEGMVFS